jgi:hypothetical protein
LENLEEMDQFFEEYNLLRWNYKEMENLIRTIMTESILKILSPEKSTGPDDIYRRNDTNSSDTLLNN